MTPNFIFAMMAVIALIMLIMHLIIIIGRDEYDSKDFWTVMLGLDALMMAVVGLILT